jgi:hypothetical protein
MRSLAVILSTVCCAFMAGCGSIGEPLYPVLNIPSRVSDLTAVERGDRIDVAFTIAPLTTEGLALKEIGSVELRAGPSPANGWNVDEWASGSTRADVPAPAHPGPVHAELPVREFVGKEIVVAVRVANAKGRSSQWSEFKTVQVVPPLAKPAGLHVAAVPQGVQVSWAAPDATQFRVYRKTGQEQKQTLLATVTEPSYLDASAEYGKTYEYSVQGVREQAESDPAGPETITPKDIFPPRVPTGLTASAGVNAIELAWDRNTEADFKEYRVYRSEEGGQFAPIAQGLEAPNYSDRKIESGKHYRYRISAADQTGNESMPCEPVEATAP